MRRVIVQYKVKPDRAAENEVLVRAVYEELHRTDPDGIQYATFGLDDGLTFIHVAFEADAKQFSLPDLPAFRAFQQGIRDRCEQAPVVRELRQIGSFGRPFVAAATAPAADAEVSLP
jgi:hypothetical protein